MKYLLIWDIDGTLIQVKGMGKSALNITFFELYGVKNAFENINMAGMLDSVVLKNAYEIYSIKCFDNDKFFDMYCKILSENIEALKPSIAYSGVIELMEHLSGSGEFCSVLGTGNIERGARIKLSVDNMNRFFPVGGFGDEEVERWQIIEEAVNKSRKHFNTDFLNSNIYIIGDTPKDVECGKILGLKTIGIATGHHTKVQLEKCGADYTFDNLGNTNTFLEIFK